MPMIDLTPAQANLLKQVVLGTLRVAIKQDDNELTVQLGEILEKFQ